MSAAACFEALPEEIARQVASVVYHEHPRSPYALMRVNKASYAAATYWWFRNVQFQLSDRKSLRYDVENFLDACRRNGGLKHTRWLEVCGSWLRHDSDEDEEEERAEAGVEDQGRPTKRPRTDRSSLLKHIYVGDTEAALRSDRLAAVYGQRLTPVSGEDLAWQPIVNLLAELANLQDLVFNTTVPFPPTLLEALNKYHPGCRLHLMHFRLPTLGEDIMNEREMALVTSTHLHTIALTWSWIAQSDYMKEAAMRLAGDVSPNLKRMILCQPSHFAVLASSPSHIRPRQIFPGLSPESSDLRRRCGGRTSLESLSLTGVGVVKAQDLKAWNMYTAFDGLNHLNLSSGVNGEALEWAAQHVAFHTLKQLTIALIRIDNGKMNRNLGQSACRFFASLRPLRTLQLRGSIDLEVLSTIFERHGHELRQMELQPCAPSRACVHKKRPTAYDKRQILQIRNSCPLLEHLIVPIKRSMGSKAEVDMYQALASMPRLTAIALTLDCSDHEVLRCQRSVARKATFTPKYTDDWMQEPFAGRSMLSSENNRVQVRNGDIYQALINNAVDHTLARSIWHTIARAKTGSPLKSLRVTVTGGGDFGGNFFKQDVRDMFVTLHRLYSLERGVRDDDDGETVHLIEPTRQKREARVREIRERAKRLKRQEMIADRPGTAMHVFRRIWPEKPGSIDWMDDWESFPLQTSVKVE